uniref:Uncharacterized protein n=1 Tax=Rhizophora mucronata TaxID=61149 RepID=A0A2P2QIE6_RHIMU
MYHISGKAIAAKHMKTSKTRVRDTNLMVSFVK